MSEEYDYVNPEHYKQFSIETIEMMVMIYGYEKVADYCEINAFKYKMRAGTKPNQPIQRDLDKANWYLDKAEDFRARAVLCRIMEKNILEVSEDKCFDHSEMD